MVHDYFEILTGFTRAVTIFLVPGYVLGWDPAPRLVVLVLFLALVAGAVTAAQMAIDDFVAKEKPPFKVELVSADHQNKPDIATGIARQWYDTGGVDLITDVINSGVALGSAIVGPHRDLI